MTVYPTPMPATEIDDFVLAYEAACARAGAADLTAFLPPPDHALYSAVLRELVRIDLEHGWAQGRPRRLDDYQQTFPQLFGDKESLGEIAFEEYRLRRHAGENPSPTDYHQRYGVDTSAWPGPRATPTDPPTAEIRKGKPSGQAPAAGFHDHHTTPQPVLEELSRSDPAAAERLTQALNQLPHVGEEFLGFHLCGELGRGAFGQVYLARQPALANRLVALKVAPNLGGESQTLAQLQHTHIMPLYSVHESGPHHVICMPYLGTTTWADVRRGLPEEGPLPTSGKAIVDILVGNRARSVSEGGSALAHASGPVQTGPIPLRVLERLTYVEAILWLAVRLADGLAHAHERGILHRDLKPANILLTDEGQPLLLDFNLAEDTKLRLSPAAAGIGGTLPYMAPEHLESFRGNLRPVDGRSDLYAFGVILYELLTGQHPFGQPCGPLKQVLATMVADRQGLPPKLRSRNPAVSPAIEAIVRHCLEPNPARRYQTARDLQEDLQRQLDHLPLKHVLEPSFLERARKWRHRHPRLTSSTAVAILAAVLLVGAGATLAVWHRNLTRLQAVASLQQVGEDLKTLQELLLAPEPDRARLEEGIALGQQVLDRYRVLDTPAWEEGAAVRALTADERRRLVEDMGELLLAMARIVARRTATAEVQAMRGDLLTFALRLNGLAERCYPPDAVPQAVWRQRGDLAQLHGQPDEARRWLAHAEATPLRTSRDHYLLLVDHVNHGRAREALAYLQEASRLEPRSFARWLILGDCHASVGQHDDAVKCYSYGIDLQPEAPWGYYHRGLAHLQQRSYAPAVADFDTFVRLRPDVPNAYHNRALAKLGLKDAPGARADLTHALQLENASLRSWFLRAEVRAHLGDLSGAQEDHTEGLRRTPLDDLDWIDRANARLARRPWQPRADREAALGDFEQALRLNPRSHKALQGKAGMLSDLGRTEEAVAVLDQAIILYPDYVPARAGRGVLLARLGRRAAAHADAVETLRRDTKPFTLYQVAGIYALTSPQHSEDRQEALRLLSAALRQGIAVEQLDKDPDLNPLRGQPEFQELIKAARTLRGRPASKALGP